MKKGTAHIGTISIGTGNISAQGVSPVIGVAPAGGLKIGVTGITQGTFY